MYNPISACREKEREREIDRQTDREETADTTTRNRVSPIDTDNEKHRQLVIDGRNDKI